jgi:hypothetical protein
MIKETWRGWQGHWCIHAAWHLNTLLEIGNKKYVISTVGQGYNSIKKDWSTEAGRDGQMFETFVFESDYTEWNDADVSKDLESNRYKTEEEAQKGHYNMIELIKERYS